MLILPTEKGALIKRLTMELKDISLSLPSMPLGLASLGQRAWGKRGENRRSQGEGRNSSNNRKQIVQLYKENLAGGYRGIFGYILAGGCRGIFWQI